jgi:hypothetical protein
MLASGVHTRFLDDDDAMQAEPSAPPPPPPAAPAGAPPPPPGAAAPAAATALRALSSVRADHGAADPCYVFQLAHSPATGLVAATLSSRRVKLYALADGALRFAAELAGHAGRVTDAHFDLPGEPHLLLTSGADGAVRGWDVRAGGAPVEEYRAGPGAEALCCHSNGALVAAGAGDAVLFWDRRTHRAAAAFADTHARDVTQVRFHPSAPARLVTASDDGMVCVFDAGGALDEEEGFAAGVNVDTGVARLGFYGPAGERLWLASTTESLHLWEWAAACEDGAEGGAGPLGEALEARAALAAAAAGTPLGGGVDYLVGCEWDAAAQRLLLAAGTSVGAAALFPVAEPRALGRALVFGPPAALLLGEHDDVVRAVVRPGGAGPLLLSGGEDARICVWSAEGAGAGAGAASSGSDGAVRRPVHGRAHRASPY